MLPMQLYLQVIFAKDNIGKYVVIGAASVILPGVNISEGTSCGRMSLINKDTEPWYLYYGIHIKKRKECKRENLKIV